MNMPNSDHVQLDSMDVQMITKEVSHVLLTSGYGGQIIKDNIFKLLEKECSIIYYPIDDDEICAFYRKVDDRKFVCINTSIPFEKQVFAAAHELAHALGVAEDRSELLKSVAVGDYTDEHEGADSNKEKVEEIANRFAAELLVQTNILKKELESRNCKQDQIDMRTIIELMDLFLVPYKTIVRRIHEINYFTFEKCEEMLRIPARGEDSPIVHYQRRLELCSPNNERTEKKKLANFVDLSLISYEKKLRTFEALSSMLSFAEKTPEEFGITVNEEQFLTEEELDRLLSDEA